MISISEVCEAFCDYRTRTGATPNRITFGPNTWKQIRDFIIGFQRASQPFIFLGMQVTVEEGIDGFELSEDQPIAYTRYFLKGEYDASRP